MVLAFTSGVVFLQNPSGPELLVACLFFASVALVVYTYAGYPVVLWVCSFVFGRKLTPPQIPDDLLPVVSVLVAAYNEAPVIERRVRNLLALDYPPDRLQVIVASDGSDDDTVEIVRRLEVPNVLVLAYPFRRGKASVLNDAMREARGDIVLLSDANTSTDPRAARALARWFADPSMGVVCGRLVLTDPVNGTNVDSVYWQYETVLKQLESRLGALLGANGAIYAIRRSLFTGVRANTAVDDFVIPLLTRIRTDCRLIYDRDAVAYEETPAGIRDEFRRRSRIGAGGFQSLTVLAPLLHPRFGWTALSFWSHKILRWTSPLLLIAAFASSTALAPTSPFFAGVAGAQIALYALAIVGLFVDGSSLAARTVRLMSMFASMNLALFVGFWLWASGRQQGTWQRTTR